MGLDLNTRRELDERILNLQKRFHDRALELQKQSDDRLRALERSLRIEIGYQRTRIDRHVG